MFTIEKDFTFSASHQLTGLVEGHQCGRLHGHNYTVRVRLQSNHLDQHGFVLDYGQLAPVKAWIDSHLDHRHLNDVPDVAAGTANTTAEIMARCIALQVEELLDLPRNVQVSVGVSETPKTWAWWTP